MKSKSSLLLAISLASALAACAKPPRSYEYFRAHQDEAKAVIEACKNNTVSGEECNTAYNAVPRNLFIH